MAQTYNHSDFRDRTIRSSKLKTLTGCSYLYYTSYVIGLPQKQNSGAEKGTICHNILEQLATLKRRKIYNKIINEKSIYCHPPIARLVNIYIDKTQTLTRSDEILSHLNEMIMVGLKTDYFVEGAKIIAHEYKFEMKNDSPNYKIKGFFDKVSVKGDYLIIDDYKSSKRQFEGEDKESNVQAMIYSLAALKLWPDKKPKIRFIFLQYPKDPIMEVEFSKDVLKGFETYLELVQEKINVFSAKDAVKDMAAYKEAPSTGEFEGKLLCGRAVSPKQLKKDGTPMWHCPMKFSFIYGEIRKGGEIVYTCSEKDMSKINLHAGETIEKRTYGGCPAHNQVSPLENFSPPKAAKTKIETSNVLRGMFDEINKAKSNKYTQKNVLEDF